VVRTQLGQRRISISVSLIIDSPFLGSGKFYHAHVLSAVRFARQIELLKEDSL